VLLPRLANRSHPNTRAMHGATPAPRSSHRGEDPSQYEPRPQCKGHGTKMGLQETTRLRSCTNSGLHENILSLKIKLHFIKRQTCFCHVFTRQSRRTQSGPSQTQLLRRSTAWHATHRPLRAEGDPRYTGLYNPRRINPHSLRPQPLETQLLRSARST